LRLLVVNVDFMGRRIVFMSMLGFAILGQAPIFADPFLYTFAGVASGSIGSATFADANFVISVLADTNNIQFTNFFFFNIFSLDDNSATISVQRLPTATFSIPTRVFASHGFARHVVGFSRTGLAGTELLDITDNLLEFFDLSFPIGPIGPDSAFGLDPLHPVPSDQGDVTLNGASDVVFQAEKAQSAVPEPSSYVLLATTLAVLAWASRRRNHV